MVMASNRQEDSHNLLIEPKVPHFFKVILPGTLGNGKLVIPKKFVNRYGKALRNQVVLKVPNGTLWPVKITKCNENVCLDLGWQEFVKFYSLEVGHFLVFRYERSSTFSVVIFNKTATEIDYPVSNRRDNKQDPKKNREDASVKRLRNMTKEATVFQSKKRRKTCMTSGKDELLRTGAEQHCPKPVCGGADSAAKDYGHVSKTEGTLKSSYRVLKTTKDRRSVNPFFTVTLLPSAVSPSGSLSIPSSFAKIYLKENTSFILEDSGGRAWTVKCMVYGMSGGWLRAKLMGGWTRFVRENDLRVGDSCSFELVEGAKMLMKVTIFRSLEDEDSSLELRDFTDMATAAEDHNPFFKIIMKPSYVGGLATNLWIPSGFAKKYLTGSEDAILVSQDGKKWNVKCYVRESKEASFTSGWKIFAKDNKLEVGDVCIFRLIKSKKLSLRFSISRGSLLAGQFTTEESQLLLEERSSKNIAKNAGHIGSSARDNGVHKTGEAPSLYKAGIGRRAYENDRLFFRIVMASSYVGCRYVMNVPLKFVKKHFNQKLTNVSLLVSNRTVWSVKYGFWVSKKNAGARFNTGWKAFATDNNLKVGDACTFELLDSVKNILNVTICRSV